MTRRRFALYILTLIILIFSILTVNLGNPLEFIKRTQSIEEYAGDTSLSVDLIDVIYRVSERRYIQATVKADDSAVIKGVMVNGERVFTWYAENLTLSKGDVEKILIYYPWVGNESYRIDIMIDDGRVWETTTARPVEFEVAFELFDVWTETSTTGEKIIKANYSLKSSGYSNLTVMAFFSEYNHKDLPIFIFYDRNFMPNQTLQRADEIKKCCEYFGYNVRMITWLELDDIATKMEPCILILLNPLMDSNETEIYDVIPSIISDRNGNGFLKDDSDYKRSYLYDWMRKGMIFITPDSTQPNWRILYDDGSVTETKDKIAWNDASKMFTDADKTIQIGWGSAGTPRPKLNIEKTLGLKTWKGKWGFGENSLRSEGIEYYPYGSFLLTLEGKDYITYLPAFIRVGEGGWITMRDINLSKDVSGEAIDLAKIILHEPWNTNWIREGWNYDSSRKFYKGMGGRVELNDTISVIIPSNVLTAKTYTLRVYLTAYNEDKGEYIAVKRYKEVEI